MNKKSILLILLSLCFLSGNLFAEEAKPLVAEKKEDRDSKSKETLIDQVKNDVIPDTNQLYVDLAREMEIAQRQNALNENSLIISEKIKLMQSELNRGISELEKLQKTADEKIKQSEDKNDNLKLVVSLYESISADQAAGLLKQLPITVSIKMIQMMSPKKSSKILAAMDSKYAAEVSRRLIKQPATVATATPTPEEGK